MDITLEQNRHIDLGDKIIRVMAGFTLSGIQKTLSDAFENLPQDSAVNYIGELNKNDIMH